MNLELYESTWVAMSVGLSLIIGFVAFVVMMNGKTRMTKTMNRKTIYIAGPMAGILDYNAKAFYAACDKLRADGWMPINPVAFNGVFGRDPTGKLLDAVCESERAAIPFLDAIYLLKGWENSKGAKRELEVALKHGLQVIVEESKSGR